MNEHWTWMNDCIYFYSYLFLFYSVPILADFTFPDYLQTEVLMNALLDVLKQERFKDVVIVTSANTSELYASDFWCCMQLARKWIS